MDETDLEKENDDIDSDILKLKEIQEKIAELLSDAEYIVKINGDKKILDRAKAYWIPHIKMALFNDTEYLGKSMVTMEDTISEVEKFKKKEEDSD